jgi:hypothetical protein
MLEPPVERFRSGSKSQSLDTLGFSSSATGKTVPPSSSTAPTHQGVRRPQDVLQSKSAVQEGSIQRCFNSLYMKQDEESGFGCFGFAFFAMSECCPHLGCL